MTVIKQCLVAMCFVIFGKVARTVLATYNYGPIRLKWCDHNGCRNMTYYPDEAQKIEISSNTELIPVKAFQNADNLRYIKGVNKNIRILASRSFFNLPAVDKIDLSFNLIRYIHYGIFFNVSVKELNLSWNKIMYIEEISFHGIRNLEKLDLSHNEIPVFCDLPRSSPLQKLNLSYNFLREIEISKQNYRHLTVLDLSFNRLKEFRISSSIPMRKIDLTKNSLKTLSMFDIVAVDELRIALNEFIYVPENLSLGSTLIRKIALYPNIWKCDELEKLWKKLYIHGITLLPYDDDYRLAVPTKSFAICYVDYSKPEPLLENMINETIRKIFQDISLKFIKDNHTPCKENHMCSDYELCRNRQCYNPCREGVCDITSLCKTENHAFRCECLKNQKRDPMRLDSRCYTAECFNTDDCPDGQICKSHLCQK